MNTTQQKRFTNLKVQFAQHGYILHRSGPGDGPGPVSFMADHGGMVRYFPTLNDAERLLAQMGDGS